VIGQDAPIATAELAHHPSVREHVRHAFARWNARQSGSSQRVERVLLLPDAPSIDGNEITDKGYINQRLALERRQLDVERLFVLSPDPDIVLV
jgi:feruloyl-CoA synthase